jgi:trimeric autotransporter adhesin
MNHAYCFDSTRSRVKRFCYSTTAIRVCALLFLILAFLVLSPCAVSAQGALVNGTTTSGTISPAGDSDTWTFSATAGDSIIVRVGEITQTGAFAPRIRLLNPSSVQIASASDTVAPEVAVTATNTGTFTVIVDDAVGTTATGTYRITLAQAPGPVFVASDDEGGALANGVTYETNNLPPGDLDVWSFVANSGDSFVVKVGQSSETNLFEPWIRLYGPTGNLLFSQFSAASIEVALRATNSGSFTVVVANNPYFTDAASGTYRITLAKTGVPGIVASGDEGGPITNGVAHQGNLPTGDIDLWDFNASIGDSIVLKIGLITEVGAFSPWIRLYGPSGVLLDSQWDASSAEITLKATNSGTFFVVVANNPYFSDAGSGTYLLNLAKTGDPIIISAGDEGGPMTNGVAHQGSIGVGDLDLWNFTANAGEPLVLKIGSITEVGAFSPWIRLYGPNGALLDSQWSANSAEISLRATNSGTFLVVVANNPYYSAAGKGTYLLNLAKTGSPITVTPGDEGGPLTNGIAQVATMPIGDLDLWSFTAAAGQNIIVRAGQIAETNNFDPSIRIYGPDGALLGSDAPAAAAEVAFRATNSGTFFVIVANDPYLSDAGHGTYMINLVKTGDAVVVSPGDEGGALNGSGSYNATMPIGDLDLWSFTACAGDPIRVRADEITQTNNFAPWVRVYGPSGLLLGSVFGATSAEVSLIATNRGTYLAVIGNNEYYNNAGNGTYQLVVNGLSDGMKLCIPQISGTNSNIGGIGGTPSASYVLFTHTNITTPVASWTPLVTNQFDSSGFFNYTNPYSSLEKQRYFRLRSP